MRVRSLRGVTLIELMISAVIVAIVVVSVARVYGTTLTFDGRVRSERGAIQRTQILEDRIANFIRHAELSLDTAQQASYFIGSVGNVAGTDPSQTNNASSAANSATSLGVSGNADTLIMTVSGLRVPSAKLDSDDDFETQNQSQGPQGGIEEIALSTSPVGTPPNGQTGLFLRYQRPADSDPSQGGNELLLAPNVTSIHFEFWDGSQYETTWDTRSMTPKRLPAAVRVSYHLENEENDRMFVVWVPRSDVTTTNPVVQSGSSTTP